MSEEEKEAIEILKDDIVAYAAGHEKYENAVKIAINLIDKLQKENKKYIDVFNSTEKIMNGQERTKDKLLKENIELQKENEQLTNELSKTQCDNRQMEDNSISKDKVREVLKDIYYYYGQNNDMFLVDKIRKKLLGE